MDISIQTENLRTTTIGKIIPMALSIQNQTKRHMPKFNGIHSAYFGQFLQEYCGVLTCLT